MSTGKLIAFEGGEGCGKTTQAQLLAERLGAVLTREPGGTPIGERVRAILLDPELDDLDARAEALLMAAARAQHVSQVVAPALAAGRHVVTDRFVDSSLAYQGFGRGLPLDELRHLSDWGGHGVRPDVVVLLDVPAAVAEARLGERDRFELEAPGFHERVRAGFQTLAAGAPDRWVVIDGTGSVDRVAALVWDGVIERLGLRR